MWLKTEAKCLKAIVKDKRGPGTGRILQHSLGGKWRLKRVDLSLPAISSGFKDLPENPDDHRHMAIMGLLFSPIL